MPSAADIRKQIASDVAATQPANPNTPGIGTVVSHPGTEKIMFDATTFQLMECEGRVKGNDKRRYCFVEKGVKVQYGNQFTNSIGDRVYIITKDMFIILLGVFNNIMKQLRDLDSKARMMEEKADLYKMTIDALKKNGIID